MSYLRKIKPVGWVIVAFALVQVAIIFFFANGPHDDEAVHILSGMSVWQETPWLSFIKLPPLFAAGYFAGGLEGARIVALVIAVIGLIVLAKVAESFFGARAAFWGMLALCFNGLFNVFAHFADGGVTLWLWAILVFWGMTRANRLIGIIFFAISFIISVAFFITPENIYDSILFSVYALGVPMVLAIIGSAMTWHDGEQSLLIATWLFSLTLHFVVPESRIVLGVAFLYPLIGVMLDRVWNSRMRFAIPLILAAMFVWGRVQWNAQEYSWNDVRPAAQYLLENFQKGDRLAARDASSFLLYLYPRGLANLEDVFDENAAARMELDLCQVQWLVGVNKGIRNTVLDDEVQYALKRCGHNTKLTYADSVVRMTETTPFASWHSVIGVAHLESPRPTETLVWRMGQPVPQGRFEAQGLAVNGKLYVFGGFVVSPEGRTLAIKRVDVYDPVTKQWLHKAEMPVAVTHAGTAVDGSTVYFVGGFIGDHPGPMTDQTWKYDTLTNVWSDFQPLPAPRASGVAVQINHTLHFFAGAQRTLQGIYEKDFGDHWVLDLAGEAKWLPAAPLPNPRSHLAAVVLNGKIYVLGGEILGDEVFGNVIWVDVYDPAKDQWTTAKPLPYPLGHASSSTFVMCNRILVIGGVTYNWLNLDSVLAYDPIQNSWATLLALPAPRLSPLADVIGNRIIVTGGLLGTEKRQTWITDWQCP